MQSVPGPERIGDAAICKAVENVTTRPSRNGIYGVVAEQERALILRASFRIIFAAVASSAFRYR